MVLRRQASRLAERQFRSFFDLVPVNRPARDFEDIHRVVTVRAILRTGIIALRANRDIPFDMRHPLFAVNPNEIERDLGILHPESPGLGLAEEKEHSVVLLEVVPIHESDGALEGRVGDFGLDGGAGRSVNRRELSSCGSGHPHIIG